MISESSQTANDLKRMEYRLAKWSYWNTGEMSSIQKGGQSFEKFEYFADLEIAESEISSD